LPPGRGTGVGAADMLLKGRAHEKERDAQRAPGDAGGREEAWRACRE
jgi:hypothetical protein